MHFLVDCLFDLCACQAHFSSSGMILFRASILIKDSVTSPQQGFINLPILTCPKSFSFHPSKEIRPDEWQSPRATHIPSDGRSFVCRLPMTLRPRPQTVSSSARPAVTQNDTVRDARNCREEEKKQLNHSVTQTLIGRKESVLPRRLSDGIRMSHDFYFRMAKMKTRKKQRNSSYHLSPSHSSPPSPPSPILSAPPLLFPP